MDRVIMSDEFTEKFMDDSEEYNDVIFWDELETRLGKRDFERTITNAEKKEIAERGGWYSNRIEEIYRGWSTEIEKHGIERLGIVESIKPSKKV
jgi:hypothetical protein